MGAPATPASSLRAPRSVSALLVPVRLSLPVFSAVGQSRGGVGPRDRARSGRVRCPEHLGGSLPPASVAPATSGRHRPQVPPARPPGGGEPWGGLARRSGFG